MRLGLKILMVLAMTLAILVPLTMIGGIVGERQAYQAQAVQTVGKSFAGRQSLTGPVLVVPYVETIEVQEKDAQGVVQRVLRDQQRQWTFFPETMDMVGTLTPIERRVGIYKAHVYLLDATTKATFRVRIPTDADALAPRRIGRPSLAYGMADVRGLRSVPRLTVGGADVLLQRGLGLGDGTGLHGLLAAPKAGQALSIDSDLRVKLGGTEALAIAPLAARNRVAISSTWPHPQFKGEFLPNQPRIDDRGFQAQWEVSSLASNAQAQYLQSRGRTVDTSASATSDDGSPMPAGSGHAMDTIGISLVDPVNPYSQADRATKYGLLFVALTFVGFFMFELIKQLRIHPIQYALVGLALAIFFLLLVSLSEHIAFGWAYLVASVACIGLLGVYVGAVLGSTWRGLGFAAMLATLYGALYGLLVSEDNALVMGAGLLFVILAAIMLVTRRVDWYALAANLRS